MFYYDSGLKQNVLDNGGHKEHNLGQEKEKLYSINDEEYRIIAKYKKLNENNKGKIEERIDTLLENQQDEEAKVRETI